MCALHRSRRGVLSKSNERGSMQACGVGVIRLERNRHVPFPSVDDLLLENN